MYFEDNGQEGKIKFVSIARELVPQNMRKVMVDFSEEQEQSVDEGHVIGGVRSRSVEIYGKCYQKNRDKIRKRRNERARNQRILKTEEKKK